MSVALAGKKLHPQDGSEVRVHEGKIDPDLLPFEPDGTAKRPSKHPSSGLLSHRQLPFRNAALGKNGLRRRSRRDDLRHLPLREKKTGLLLAKLQLHGTNVIRPSGVSQQKNQRAESQGPYCQRAHTGPTRQSRSARLRPETMTQLTKVVNTL